MRILWKPQKKQAEALECPAFEMLYGGAAGGGKSDFLLADFLGMVPKWGKDWKGIIFRRTYSELEELLKRAKEMYVPIGGTWIAGEKQFVFPNGSAIRFGYLERDNDVTRYQGHQYTWVAFDELGNYKTDFAWRYMISRIRSPAGAPCYIRGTANPGGVGHAWIKNRFVDGFIPGKIYKFNSDGDITTRCFIPSLLDDNRILMQNDPGYARRLKNLPSHIYRALRYGDWDVFAGQVFDEWRREKHVVKPFALEQTSWHKFYSFDWGYQKPYALLKLAVNGDGKVVQYGEIYGCLPGEINKGTREGSELIAAKAKAPADAEGVTELVADPSCWNKQDSHPSVIEAFQKAGFRCTKANNDRIPGWNKLHELLKTEDEYGRPMLQVFETCAHTIRTLPGLLPDPNRPEDVDSDMEDHAPDALRYGVMSLTAKYPDRGLRRGAMPKRRDTLRDNGF
ncbi:MAG: terminase family protein [Treponema sp.]|jgi:hypothetical protein|nr:terminase family protein [Treponema sp.]